MVEPNNNYVENKPKKKKVLFKFVMSYVAIAIIVTVGSILFYKNTGINIVDYLTEKINLSNENSEFNLQNEIYNNEVIENEIEEKSNIEPSKLTDKYSMNNIELKEIKEEINSNYVYKNEDEKDYKNQLTYYQISGLKDKTVQDKINQDIKQKIKNLLIQEEIENEEIDYIIIDSYVFANFANVISIEVYKTIYYIENEEKDFQYENTRIGLNYRLDTGEELEFEDLFNKNASIKNILSQALYKNLALEYGNEYLMTSNDYWDSDMDNVDYSKIELEVFRAIDSYNKNNDIEFSFYYDSITTELNGRYITIDMTDCYEYITIFNLVSPKSSLYENGNLEKVDYVFATPYISNCMFFQKISSNIFLSVFSMYSEDANDELYLEYKNLVDENLNYIVALIKQNESREENQNGKGKIYNINYLYESDEGIYGSGQKVEVNLENFDEEIENTFLEACRQEPVGEYMLNLPYSEENYYDIQLKEIEDSILQLYQKRNIEIIWTGSDGSKMDLYGIIIE